MAFTKLFGAHLRGQIVVEQCTRKHTQKNGPTDRLTNRVTHWRYKLYVMYIARHSSYMTAQSISNHADDNEVYNT